MTTLAVDTAPVYELGDRNEFPVIAADIIYEGSAVGDNASGYARPLVSGDPFRGFAEAKADNSAGAAGAINVRTHEKGKIKLAISGVAITDVGRPVHATDDATFVLTGIGSYIGKITRYDSAGFAIVAFDATAAGGGEVVTTLTFPITMASIADGDVVTAFTPGFAGVIKSMHWVQDVAVTTAAKLSTLNVEIGTTDVTGGTIALTSAACTPQGVIIDAAAITAGAAFTASDTISIEASATTTFIEGTGSVVVVLGR
jgi:hypothetical protein